MFPGWLGSRTGVVDPRIAARRWREGSDGDDVYGRRDVETAVGGDQWKIEHDRQLDVQGVNQSELVTPRPRADEKLTDIVALDRSGAEITEPGLDVFGLEIAGTMQPSESREDLGVKVRRCVQTVTCEPPTNGAPELVVEQ